MTLVVPGGNTSDKLFDPSIPGLSVEAQALDQSIFEAYEHWSETLTSQQGSFEQAFDALTAQWKKDTEYQSSIAQIALHEAYQRIIGMGYIALPLILRDLEATQAPWFWALRAITGEDPIPPEDKGYIDRMVRAWVRWGIRKNLL
jgi:hypothetical protein